MSSTRKGRMQDGSGSSDGGVAGGQVRFADAGFVLFYSLSLALAAAAGYLPAAFFAPSVLLALLLCALSIIDARTLRLPNYLTLPLIAAGIAISAALDADAGAGALRSVIGAAAGLALIAGIGWAYRRWRGRPGIGFGDAKLLAGAGAWLGLEGLPSVLLVACGAGLVFAAALHAAGRSVGRATAIPFGPAIAIGIWTVWLLGPLA